MSLHLAEPAASDYVCQHRIVVLIFMLGEDKKCFLHSELLIGFAVFFSQEF